MYIPRFLFASMALLLLSTGCGLTQRPVPSDQFELRWQVKEPTRAQAEARLFLSDDGYWGYQPVERAQFTPRFAPGDLTYWEGPQWRHYFVVVQTARWGYRLQRLDDHPLATEMTGYLVDLTEHDVEHFDDLCLLHPGDQVESTCGRGVRHLRWHLFELQPTEGTHLATAGNFDNLDRGLRFPVVSAALSGVDRLSSWTDRSSLTDENQPLLAIKASPRASSTFSARIVYDPACTDFPLERLAQMAARAEFVAAPAPLHIAPAHPLVVEAAALAHGADALVTCQGSTPLLHVPVLSRPLLREDAGRYETPSSLGLLPRNLGRFNQIQQTAWTLAGAFVAVGDATAAAFWIEQALRDAEPNDATSELGLAALTTLAGAGRSELAMRVGNTLTSSAWNPENVPDYLDALILLLGQFQMLSEQNERMKRRQSLASQRQDHHRTAFYQWAAVRLSFAQQRGHYGPAFDKLLSDIEDNGDELWALAIWATLTMEGAELPRVESPAELRPRFSNQDLATFWDYVLNNSAPVRCAENGQNLCGSHTYGWSSETIPGPDDLIERLRTTPATTLKRGFSQENLTTKANAMADHHQRTAFWIAAAPLVATTDLLPTTEALLQSLRTLSARDHAGLCADPQLWQARFENAAARSRAPIMSANRRQWLNFIEWWARDGIPGLCDEDPAQFLAALSKTGERTNEWGRLSLPLLEDRLLRATAPANTAATFQQATELARRLGDRDTCALWSLGMSIGAARSGYLDAANSHLLTATNCLESDSALRSARNLVAGYVDFERGAGRSLIRDGAVDRALAEATQKRIDDPNTCIGLLPLGFHFENHLPSAVMRIAERVQLAPRPHGEFRLQTASAVIDEAIAAYSSGLRDLQRGQLTTAARALELARSNFRHLQHLPGLLRIAYLDEVIFAGALAALAEDASTELPAAGSELRDQLRRGQAHLLVNGLTEPLTVDASADPDALIAALLLHAREETLSEHFRRTSELSPLLCRQAEEEDHITETADHHP